MSLDPIRWESLFKTKNTRMPFGLLLCRIHYWSVSGVCWSCTKGQQVLQKEQWLADSLAWELLWQTMKHPSHLRRRQTIQATWAKLQHLCLSLLPGQPHSVPPLRRRHPLCRGPDWLTSLLFPGHQWSSPDPPQSLEEVDSLGERAHKTHWVKIWTNEEQMKQNWKRNKLEDSHLAVQASLISWHLFQLCEPLWHPGIAAEEQRDINSKPVK